jgi:hypothetical protein
MTVPTVKYRDWEFEVDRELTKTTYANVLGSGADTCVCNDCKNYAAFRDQVFPDEVLKLFNGLGIDYRKEVEITSWEKLPNGLYHIGGWFHFKGKLLKGKDYRVPIAGGNGFTFDLTKIGDNFSIGFGEGNDLTYFEEKDGLVQIEFDTNIPWIIDKSLETT